jgi:hypothetical protein
MKENFTAFMADDNLLDNVNLVCNKLGCNRSQLIRHALKKTCHEYEYIFSDPDDFVIMKKTDLQKMCAKLQQEMSQFIDEKIQTCTDSLVNNMTERIWDKISK